ncbi:MAG: hypothetical protein WCF05_04435 [Chromatiaceae bacterium]
MAQVLASDGHHNLKGPAKTAALVACFGQGASTMSVIPAADLAVWAPALWRALRLHQWAKYLLLFLPLLAAHQLSDGTPPARRRPRLPGLRAYRLRRLSG